MLPLDVCGELLDFYCATYANRNKMDSVLYYLSCFLCTKDINSLYSALLSFCVHNSWDAPHMLIEVSKHFEDGAKKYGERNWEKGIPTHCYIDSAVRHYLKWYMDLVDERHDRAFCWNLLCCAWTLKHRPECDDLP